MGSYTTGHFDVTLLDGRLHVGFIPSEKLLMCAHAITKLMVLDAEDDFDPFQPTLSGHGEEKTDVNVLLVQDSSGMTVIVNDRYLRKLKLMGTDKVMKWAPLAWRALQIHLGPASADAPGIISYLSTMLSENNVSILNFSTFDADLILVQEHDVSTAQKVMVAHGKEGVYGLLNQIDKHKANANIPEDRNVRTRKPRSDSFVSEEAALAVVDAPLVLTSMKRNQLKECCFGFIKQLTQNTDFVLELQQREGTRVRGPGAPDFFWVYASTADEVSVLMDERDLVHFPEDLIVVLPQRWRAIRLLGKDIAFDEVGIVSLMSSPFEAGVQLLNMSTYATNLSLVAETDLKDALTVLKAKLGPKTVVF